MAFVATGIIPMRKLHLLQVQKFYQITRLRGDLKNQV